MKTRTLTLALAGWLTLQAIGVQADASDGPPVPMNLGPTMAGHFRLMARDGTVIDSDTLSGHPYGVFFGFTHCPDICPTTLNMLSVALSGLGDAAAGLRIYFVSVDPERDTRERLAEYMDSFDPHIMALSGERAAVEEAERTFDVTARRTPLPDGDYTFAHSASVLLVDENGLVIDRISAEEEPSDVAKRLSRIWGHVAATTKVH